MRIGEEHDLGIRNSGIERSDFIRQAIQEKLEKEDDDFINKQIRIKKEELERLETYKKLMKEKELIKSNIPKGELPWLIETKKMIQNRPEYINGRLRLYLKQFSKSYKLTKKEFLELLQEAENQYIEKEVVNFTPNGK